MIFKKFPSVACHCCQHYDYAANKLNRATGVRHLPPLQSRAIHDEKDETCRGNSLPGAKQHRATAITLLLLLLSSSLLLLLYTTFYNNNYSSRDFSLFFTFFATVAAAATVLLPHFSKQQTWPTTIVSKVYQWHHST